MLVNFNDNVYTSFKWSTVTNVISAENKCHACLGGGVKRLSLGAMTHYAEYVYKK